MTTVSSITPKIVTMVMDHVYVDKKWPNYSIWRYRPHSNRYGSAIFFCTVVIKLYTQTSSLSMEGLKYRRPLQLPWREGSTCKMDKISLKFSSATDVMIYKANQFWLMCRASTHFNCYQKRVKKMSNHVTYIHFEFSFQQSYKWLRISNDF